MSIRTLILAVSLMACAKPYIAVKADIITSGKQYRACTDHGCWYCNNNKDQETDALLKCVDVAKREY